MSDRSIKKAWIGRSYSQIHLKSPPEGISFIETMIKTSVLMLKAKFENNVMHLKLMIMSFSLKSIKGVQMLAVRTLTNFF